MSNKRTDASKGAYTIQKKEEKNGELSVEVEMSTEFVASFRDHAIREYKADVELPGFRKGHAPDAMIVERAGEMALFEKAAYKALNEVIPVIIAEEKIDALTQPAVSITKLAPGNPVTFTMTVTLMPEFALPDYKKIAKEVAPAKTEDATDKEVDEYIDYLRTQRRDSLAMAKNEKIEKDAPLPELDDEFVKTLGKFKDVADFKAQLKTNIGEAKKQKEQERRRLEILEKIIAETKGNVPEILLEQELNRMMQKFRHNIEGMRMQFEDYLKEIKKTEDDLRKEWKVDAEKRVKMNIILPKIAEAEKLKADPAEVKKEVAHIKEHDASIDETHATMYVISVLTNEAAFKFLEGVK